MRLDQIEEARSLARDRDYLINTRREVANAFQHPGDQIAFNIDLRDGRCRTLGMTPAEVDALILDRLRTIDERLIVLGVELPARAVGDG